MRKLTGLLAISVVVLLSSFAATDWVNFQSKEGKFTIKFPRQPVAASQKVDNEVFRIKLYTFVYDATKYKDDNEVYLTMYCDYPDTLVNSDFREEIVDTILKGSIDGMAGNMNGTIMSIDNINYKDFPGKKVKMDLKGGQGFAYVRIYLVHNRMYMLEVLCDPKKDHNASIDKFFDSFVITDTKASVKKPVSKH